MLREKLFDKIKRRYVLIVLSILTIAVVGLGLYSVLSNNGESAEIVNTEQISEEKQEEIKEFVENKRLVRIDHKEAAGLGGVLAGFSYYIGFPLWLLRILFVVAVLWWDEGSEYLIIGYILMWMFMPAIDFMPPDFDIRTS